MRALGQTDLNPASAVGKLSQLIFAFVAPGHIVANIVAGALAEAGAMQVRSNSHLELSIRFQPYHPLDRQHAVSMGLQAGDLMQDLKTGHLLGCSPRAQFFGQLIGASASVFITVGAYQMYDNVYGIPSAQASWPCLLHAEAQSSMKHCS